MENQIKEILERNFKGQNIDPALKELRFLLRIERSDDPVCPKCGNSDSNNFGTTGNYVDSDGMSGTEYICDDCGETFDFDDFA